MLKVLIRNLFKCFYIYCLLLNGDLKSRYLKDNGFFDCE